MSWRRVTAAFVCAAALALPTACGEDGDSASGESDAAAPQAPRADSKRCLARQADRVYGVALQVQRLTRIVLSDPGRQQASDVEPLRAALRKVVVRTKRFCHGAPVAMGPLLALAKSAGETGVDEPGLRRIIHVLQTWGHAVGRPNDARILYLADPCDTLRDSLDVSYVVRERPESGGKAVRLQIRVVNHFSRGVYVDHGGRMTATLVRPTGATKTYDWGGSSGETAAAGPGHTNIGPVYLGPDPDLHLYSDGEVRVFDTLGSAYGVGFGPCGIKVRAPVG